ncbi:unnamed protein product, partial [Prorocentrum cordatum]
VSAAQWLDGTVQEALPHGLVVGVLPQPGAALTAERRGLVYATELDCPSEDPAADFAIGQTVRVRLLDVEPEPGTGLLALSMKSAAAEVAADAEAQAAVAALRAQAPELGDTPAEEPQAEVDEERAAALAALRETRARLKAFLDVPPLQWLPAVVEQ